MGSLVDPVPVVRRVCRLRTDSEAEETHAYIRKWLADNVSEKATLRA